MTILLSPLRAADCMFLSFRCRRDYLNKTRVPSIKFPIDPGVTVSVSPIDVHIVLESLFVQKNTISQASLHWQKSINPPYRVLLGCLLLTNQWVCKYSILCLFCSRPLLTEAKLIVMNCSASTGVLLTSSFSKSLWGMVADAMATMQNASIEMMDFSQLSSWYI